MLLLYIYEAINTLNRDYLLSAHPSPLAIHQTFYSCAIIRKNHTRKIIK